MKPKPRPPGEFAQEIERSRRAGSRPERWSAMATRSGIERDRRRVVEEGFALHQHGETPRRADVAEDRDHGDRIGPCATMAPRMRQARSETPKAAEERETHGEGRDDDAMDREQQTRRDLFGEAPDIDIERHLEEERRRKM